VSLDPDRIWEVIGGWWGVIGFGGQALFFMRWLVQWVRSEMLRRSVIPIAFWYCSAGGGVVLLAYAIHIENAVFIVGQGMGLIVYGRNLYLMHRARRLLPAPGE
jgi:lipid-A-disaccharide synthase-like uncharacterized protein